MTNRDVEERVAAAWARFATDHEITQIAYQMRSVSNDRAWTIGQKADQSLFCASAFKAFVMAECLRQWENNQLSLDTRLSITDDVRSFGGTFSQKPSGATVTVEEALEAMIGWSDNTATDMILRLVGPGSVRELVKSHGLTGVVIPDSTRRFALQVYGVEPDQPDPGWAALQTLLDQGTMKSSPFEVSERMAAPTSAFVQFYEAALGTNAYLVSDRARAKMADILAQSEPATILKKQLPGASALWVKGGRLNLQPYNVFSTAGRLQFGGDQPPRWLNFAFIVNRDEKTDNDRMFAAFIDVNIEVLNLVIDNLAW